MSEFHIVTLEGCNTARLGDLEHTSSKGGVIGPLVRKAIKQGILTEDCMIHVKRDDTACFLPCKASVFSNKTTKEDDKGLREVKFVPYDNPHYNKEKE